MTKSKQKYYVVWTGKEPGIYTSWDDCKAQVHGHEGARYKAFPTMEEARAAFEKPAPPISVKCAEKKEAKKPEPMLELTAEAWAVDAACSGNPGQMEYRGVELVTGKELFHFGPIYGTNNIGEFLAIVHALALIKKKGLKRTVFTDSRNALLWIKQKKCKTKLARNKKSEELFKIIERAEKWLRENTWETPVLKWDTTEWGEIPADFGRK